MSTKFKSLVYICSEICFKSVFTLLAKIVLWNLVLTAAVSATNTAIQKKNLDQA